MWMKCENGFSYISDLWHSTSRVLSLIHVSVGAVFISHWSLHSLSLLTQFLRRYSHLTYVANSTATRAESMVELPATSQTLCWCRLTNKVNKKLCYREEHSASVPANIAISDISLKVDSLGYISHAECVGEIFNYLYVIGPKCIANLAK